MKTLFSTILLFFVLNFSFAQTASVKSASEFSTLKEKGKLQMTLDGKFTKEDILNKSKYYSLYFTVDFNESTNVATINMSNNDERSRQIIIRFLAACEIRSVKVGSEDVSRDLLFEKYLR